MMINPGDHPEVKPHTLACRAASGAVILEDFLLAKYSLTMGVLASVLQAKLLQANRTEIVFIGKCLSLS